MLFTTFKVGENEYQLRLTARNCVELERKLGENPLNIFMSAGEGKLPSLEKLLVALHASMTEYNHNISMDDIYDIYDKYCENGGNLMNLMTTLLEVFKTAGYFVDDTKNKKRKN